MLPPDFPTLQLAIYLLVAVRVGGALIAAPVVGSRLVPVQVRLGLTLLAAIVLTPVAPAGSVPEDLPGYVLAMLSETAFGLLVGFGLHFVFLVVEGMAGLVGVQMGLSMTVGTDPVFFGEQDIAVKRFFVSLATLLFFQVDGLHLLIRGLQDLFVAVPLGTVGFATFGPEKLVDLLASGFLALLRLATPMLGVLLLADVGLAIAARTAPQFNLFAVGIPLKLGVGFFAISLCLPSLVPQIATLFSRLPVQLALWAR